ncbi:hypothetical protein E5843_12935 [Luteimonas yindakuii]|uniref:hypothetical protein n=1 Tax=Luteimonas yindakuii TaxID=2565782 RepID=UPI0010A2E2C3|nr:hypothetical protein [Luteimonas yindakuii]QCO68444.1 hypothetical protein E5843_12935 [Luteimonas yindakuii]
MITISVERGVVRLTSWDEVYETPGFVRALDPKSAALKEIIGVYSFSSRQPCGLKSCKQPHGNGYLVTTTDGQVTNLGSVCGKSAFSVVFTSLQKIFDRDLRAKERRERLEALQSRLPALVARFDNLRDNARPAYKAVTSLRGTGVPQPVADSVQRMMRSGDGAITTNRRGTKREREIALESGIARPDMPYYVTETVGRLSHIAALQSYDSVRKDLLELEPALHRLEGVDVSSLSDKEARHLDKVTGGLDARLDQMEQVVVTLKAFATRDNIAQLAAILDSPADRKLFSVFVASLPST